MTFTAALLAERLGGEVIGDGSVLLTGFTSADRACAGDLTFAEKDTYFAAAEASAGKQRPRNSCAISRRTTVIRMTNAPSRCIQFGYRAPPATLLPN